MQKIGLEFFKSKEIPINATIKQNICCVVVSCCCVVGLSRVVSCYVVVEEQFPRLNIHSTLSFTINFKQPNLELFL